MAKAPKTMKADHALLDASGKVVDDMNAATGIRYTDLETKGTIDYQLASQPDPVKLLWAIFGAKTGFTNRASHVRNTKGLGGSEQIAAIREMVDEMAKTGKWPETERGPITYDVPVLIEALVETLVGDGSLPDSPEKRTAATAKFNKKLAKMGETDFVKEVTAVAGVIANYRKLKGKTVVGTEKLTAMLSDDED